MTEVIKAVERFIPAGAGNTSKIQAAQSRSAVYPRWRGEHKCGEPIPVAGAGLSPLARGTRTAIPFPLLLVRFIPAGAGNTSDENASSTVLAVYPRWRGEHCGRGLEQRLRRGLSPLARGTHSRVVVFVELPRFIPAGAGINRITATGQVLTGGLSPLARGTHFQNVYHFHHTRFIPAGAGNTRSAALTTAINAVYPRWRGEHVRGRAYAEQRYGLSPLARGTLPATHCAPVAARFIPAGAGNTLLELHYIQRATVYPRWRGEHGFFR